MSTGRDKWGNYAVTLDYLEQLRASKVGKVRPVRSAADLLQKANLNRLGRKASRVERFSKAWNQVVGAELAQASEVTSYRQGELRITVSSQALAHELSVHRAQALVAALNRALDGKDTIACLRIRAGKVKKKDTGDT